MFLEIKEIMTVLAVLTATCSFSWYMYTVYFGQTRPHLFTWLIWGLVVGIACVVQFIGGAGIGAWVLAAGTLFCFGRAFAAIKHGVKDITKSDKICFGLCLVAIIVWQLTNEPFAAVLIVTGIDVAGYFPMSRNAWHNPFDENMLSHTLIAVTFAMSLFALEAYNPLTVFYPMVILAVQSIFVAYVLWRRRIKGAMKANTALN